MISGNMVGMYSQLGKTFIITDADGNELTGVVVDQETVFDATAADVRIGKTFASDEGVAQGENTITYRTSEGVELIMPGADFCITSLKLYNAYNYTKLQCIITKYVSSMDQMATEKIVLNNNVYNVGSSISMAQVTKNNEGKTIDLNIINDTDNIYIIYFFTYAEEEI